MKFLKDGSDKFVIAGVGTLAVFGSFLVAVIFFGIFLGGLGMNADLALGLSFLLWIAVVAVCIVGVISYYNSNKNRVEQVTVIREVIAPPPAVIPAAMESLPSLNDPVHPATTPVNCYPVSPDGDNMAEPESPAAPSVSYRSMISEEEVNTVGLETQPLSDEPDPPGNYRSMLLEEDKKDDQLR